MDLCLGEYFECATCGAAVLSYMWCCSTELRVVLNRLDIVVADDILDVMYDSLDSNDDGTVGV